jgi:hypothetical protein
MEHAGVAVDVGDLARTGRRVGERRVVGHQPEVVPVHLDLAEIHRADGLVLDLELVGLTGAVVRHRQRLASGGYVAVTALVLCLLVRHARLLGLKL